MLASSPTPQECPFLPSPPSSGTKLPPKSKAPALSHRERQGKERSGWERDGGTR